jgi:hypothetical protein
MSEEDEASLAKRVYRSVGPQYRGRPDAEMDSIGWTMFLILVVILVPLLPFLVIVWLITKGFDVLTGLSGGGATDEVESEE